MKAIAMASCRRNDDVGATLVVAPVARCDEWGDHKGRPYSERCGQTPLVRPLQRYDLIDAPNELIDAPIPSDWLKRSSSPGRRDYLCPVSRNSGSPRHTRRRCCAIPSRSHEPDEARRSASLSTDAADRLAIRFRATAPSIALARGAAR